MTETSAGYGGEHHWVAQRMSAIANLFLGSWFAVSLALLPDYGFDTVSGWLAGTIPSLAMLLLVASFFWHARLGLQVLIEDYVHDAGYKFAAMTLVNFAAIAGAVAAVLFILKIVVVTATTDAIRDSMSQAMAGMMQ